MSREIKHKFRGIQIAEGEGKGKWSYGDLLQRQGQCYISPHVNRVQVNGHLGKLIIMHEVDPKTVGQYIGRADDNGKELFEGQRVKFTNLSLGRFSKDEQWVEGVIAYSEETSGFYISQGKDSGWNLSQSSVIALDDEGEAAKV